MRCIYSKKGLAIQNYEKQTGLIEFSKLNGIEKKKLNLEEISNKKIWIETRMLSDEAIDSVLIR